MGGGSDLWLRRTRIITCSRQGLYWGPAGTSLFGLDAPPPQGQAPALKVTSAGGLRVSGLHIYLSLSLSLYIYIYKPNTTARPHHKGPFLSAQDNGPPPPGLFLSAQDHSPLPSQGASPPSAPPSPVAPGPTRGGRLRPKFKAPAQQRRGSGPELRLTYSKRPLALHSCPPLSPHSRATAKTAGALCHEHILAEFTIRCLCHVHDLRAQGLLLPYLLRLNVFTRSFYGGATTVSSRRAEIPKHPPVCCTRRRDNA